MAVNNNIVTAPISLREVAQLIGYGGNDLGTLCKHSCINMWSKYKPYRDSALFYQQDSDSSKTDRDTAMRRVNYGLQQPSGRSSANISYCFNDVWTYNKPRGGTYAEYYRLADFINYAHKDAPPMVSEGDIPLNLFWYEGTTVRLGHKPSFGSVNRMSYADFGFLDNYPRLCMLIEGIGNSGDTVKYIKVLSNIPENLTASFQDLKALPYPVDAVLKYALLATNMPATDGWTTDIAGYSFYALPNGGTYKHTGRLLFSNDFHVNMVMNGHRVLSSFIWETKYIGTMPSGGGSEYYYYPLSNAQYSIQVRYSVTNTGEAVTLRRSMIDVWLDKNLTIDTETRHLTPPEMFDEDGNSVESIVLPAGGTVNVGLRLPDYIFTMNSQGIHTAIVSSGRLMSVLIKVGYRGITNPVTSRAFRIKDSV